MAVKFDYVQVLQNSLLAASASSGGSYQSPWINSASSQEVFRAYVNPGHQNSADWMEYAFRVQAVVANSSGKWEMQPRGSTVWTALTTFFVLAVGVSQNVRTGTFSSSALALPLAIRFLVSTTVTNSRYYFTNYMSVPSSSQAMSAIRVVGDIAT